MSSHPSRTCGALILQHRLAVGWTQEELAERAGLSTRAISDLERGVSRAPRQATLDLLAQALALTASERAELEAAAHPHGRARAEAPTPLTASDAPAGRLNAAPELPMSRPAPATIPLTDEASDAPAKAVLAPSPRARGKLIAGLVSMLLVVAVLGGTVFFTGALAGRLSPPSGGKLCLATDFPTTGDAAEYGKSLEQAVQLAVMQNQDLGNGYTLEFRAYNDTSATGLTNPEQGVKNVTDMVHTPCILGMVGPLGSRVAAAEMPITANAGLVMISPANTDPGLTLREYAPLSPLDFDQLHPAGKKLNYFRISPNEVFHGQLDADFTIGLRPDGLGARTAYVVADRTAYGELMAGVFTQEFLSKGGTVLGTTDSPFGSAEQIGK